MSADPYSLMIELLSRIRHGTFDVIRAEMARSHMKHQKSPDPWTSLKETLAEKTAAEDQTTSDKKEASAEAEKPTTGFFHTAGLRLVDNLSAAARHKETAAFRKSIIKHLDDSRIASMLFSINSGNPGMPWDGVEVSHASDDREGLAVRMGSVSLVAEDLQEMIPDLDWDLPVPAIVPFHRGQSLFVVGPEDLRRTAIDALHSVALRLVLQKPVGMIRVTVIDPFGFSPGRPPWSLWPGAVCTDNQAIEDLIEGLSKQLERVVSEVLQKHRNIEAYNAWATAHGEAVIPLRVLIIHDCPNALSPRTIQKLHGIALNGVRCGIIPLIHWSEKPDAYGSSKLQSLAVEGVVVEPADLPWFIWRGKQFSDCRIMLDALPSVEVMEQIVLPVVRETTARSARALNFDEIRRGNDQAEGKGNSAMGIHAPLGVSENGKVVNLELGEGMATHGLIIGGTGSGKSSLMHVIITGLAEAYPPEELCFYLIDLKGGVEFKRYAAHQLPHARVVAIDCEREFALSALESLCQEMRRRMNLYRSSAEGITSIAMYRNAGGSLPRILLVMDEFQKLFSESDDLADKARSRLESLLKEGRGFGIHVFLGTQSLKGILMRGGSLEQIAIRIVLQCSPEDSREALASDNSAGSVLPKFQGIYNDHQGKKDANIQFKAAYLSPEENATRLSALSACNFATKTETVVFEGNDRKSITTCPAYAQVATIHGYEASGTPSRIWLGEPIAMEPPVEIVLDALRGRNFIALTQDQDEGTGALYNALLAVLAQNRPDDCNVTILNFLTAAHETREWLGKIAGMFPHPITVSDPSETAATLGGLMENLNSRIQSQSKPAPAHVFIFGLQFARDLRPKESYGEPSIETPAGILRFLLKEGPENRIHIIAWCDMLSNLARCGRGLLDEFGVRVAGKMEQSDSNAVFGGPVASRLRAENRAVVTDDAAPGTSRIFRPYDAPDITLFESLTKHQQTTK